MKICVLVSFVLVAILISANTQADLLPSQVDMKAAYCVQTIQNGIAFLSAPDLSESGEQKKIATDALEIANLNLRHLQRYFVVRMQYLDPLDVIAAKQQAIEDMTLKDKLFIACHESCINMKGMACATNCIASVNAKFQNCSDLSFLPF